MYTIVRSELRSSWSAWLGVALGFVMTSFALALSAMVLQSALVARGTTVPLMEADAYAYNGGINLVLCLVVGLSVVASSTELVVQSRRGAVARLALAGATPVGIVSTVVSQLTAVALASAVVGDLLAIAALRPALAYLQHERGQESAGRAAPAVVDARTLLAVGAAWVLVSVLGGLAQARRASRIPPVEALRVAQAADDSGRRMGLGRWLRAVLALVVTGLCWAMVPILTAHPDRETFTQIMQMNLLGLCVTGWFLAELSPVLVGPVTQLWTRHMPAGPAWQLGRATVLAKAARLTRSVVPVMFTVGLAFGVLGLPATYNAIFRASGYGVELGHVGAATFLVNLGLPLAVAMCGSIGSLFMMSRQRDAELALLGISGATGQQRTAVATFEALIVAGTATILGLVMALSAFVYLAYGATSTGLTFSLALPLASMLEAVLLTALVTAAATVLPTLGALRIPEPKVIARLVAE
ncbi:FtsX-like permease family protein [Luteococcus sp.]|uniref:FtsX-like permease family protein n=1 Tax=Luteococcus sp. TaxID=1969402 RepID=UPI003735DCC5